MPKHAPKSHVDTSEAQRGPATTGTTQEAPPDPIIPDPRRNVPTNIFQWFSPQARAGILVSHTGSTTPIVGSYDSFQVI